MAIYYGRDLTTDLSGDISLSGNGDIPLASSTRSTFQQLAFRLRTNPNDFSPTSRDIGANLGVFVGELINERLLSDIEDQIVLSLTDDFINLDDIKVFVVPIEDQEILVYTKVEGLFVDDLGLEESEGFEGIFSFPIFEGDAVQIIDYQETS